ncbi:hypothetical protein [Ciceribacter sp. L1K22]|uniref:hypothetical protein n=1 Tax=Ciceribacter sp. L1K22 TaxID=2820275 RepID=UPI001ABE7800|nr:hypothetical protein [Ciceribacter sp. L1K22]MBO3759750.1 hypothetical protein [Ciceribacter sp. L1K22]
MADRNDWADAAPLQLPPLVHQPARRVHLRFYPRDGSIFINDVYVIRGVGGRLLKYFADELLSTGRREFLNRELRRAKSLQLPEFKDNLETRLALLMRRLEEKKGPVRIHRPARGCIRLHFDAIPVVVVVHET